MVCPVTGEVAKGLPAKVTLHRGFLRVGAGHHHVVEPELAKAYFGKRCYGPQCEVVMKQYKQRSTVDLYRRTPYHRYWLPRSEYYQNAYDSLISGQRHMMSHGHVLTLKMNIVTGTAHTPDGCARDDEFLIEGK